MSTQGIKQKRSEGIKIYNKKSKYIAATIHNNVHDTDAVDHLHPLAFFSTFYKEKKNIYENLFPVQNVHEINIIISLHNFISIKNCQDQ